MVREVVNQRIAAQLSRRVLAVQRRLPARSHGMERNMVTPMPAPAARDTRERRAWPRSPRQIRVLLLSDDCALDEPYGAWIVDTSRGGVRIRMPGFGFPVGALLFLRGPFASARVRWTAVRVKHCRQIDGDCEMGCEFVPMATCDTTDLISGSSSTRIDRR